MRNLYQNHLKKCPPIKPLFMSVKELKQYRKYCKPLEKNDIIKAKSLIKIQFFGEVMDFMLENNCKLEQEIISWLHELKWQSQ